MALLEIRTFPDPVLRERALPVTEFNEELRKLARDMAETMYAAPGIGLAANQVGVLKQIIVVDVREGENGNSTGLLTLINPRVITGDGECVTEEGCLSLPEERADVERFCRVTVQAQDLDGTWLEFDAEGLPAIVFQHEIDHINGILFMDHLSALKRSGMKKRLRKLKAEAADAG